jgi:hypothetical protein
MFRAFKFSFSFNFNFSVGVHCNLELQVRRAYVIVYYLPKIGISCS